MEVEMVRLASLAERVESDERIGVKNYKYYPKERMKVYGPFEHQFVSNLLTKNVIQNWRIGGYFIVSQTGTGKSTLILKELGEIACEKNRRILIITPRVALT